MLRADLLGALAAAGANWRQDGRVLSLRFRLDRGERVWREVVEAPSWIIRPDLLRRRPWALRVLDTRPVEPPAPVPPVAT